MTPSDLPDGSLWGVVASVIGAILVIRKKLSKDNVEVKKDSAEIDLIKTLMAERDQARADLAAARAREDEAWRLRAEDAKMIGRFEAQVEALRKELHQLRDRVAKYEMAQELQHARDAAGSGNGGTGTAP